MPRAFLVSVKSPKSLAIALEVPQSNKWYELFSCVLLVNKIDGNGILTVLPSPTPVLPSLSLDIDLPWEDEPSPGNLRLSADGISTRLFVTYADILTSISFTMLHNTASTYNGTLPYQNMI